MRNIKYKSLFFIEFLLISFFLNSCIFSPKEIRTVVLDDIKQPMNEIKQPEIKNRKWSILVYMAADNDLESDAIEDLYEMEISRLNTDEVSVYILLDRSSSYDTSNDNWSGAKFYKLKTGRNVECKTIISEEIPCEDLGIYKNLTTEIDMSSGYCLSRALNYVKKQFPAENLGLIMWGHGTGWRTPANNQKNYKGFAYDDSSGSYMTLKQMGDAIGNALNNQKLDFLGFDTCFSGEIEVMYELRNKVKFAVGTEGLLRLSGWNYEQIFNSFALSKDKSAKKLTSVCIDEFAKEYAFSTNAAIAGVDMSEMDEYFNCFDAAMKTVANQIKTKDERDLIFNKLFNSSNCETKSFSYGEQNSDVYLDIESALNTCLKSFPENVDIFNKIKLFDEVRKRCVFNSWSSDSFDGGLGVYFGTLTAGNLISNVHDKAYKKDFELEQIEFVKNSNGYVPGTKEKNSFIDKLFYFDF